MTTAETHTRGETATAHRVSLYGFLARVFSREVSRNFLSRIKNTNFKSVLYEIGLDLGQAFFDTPAVELLENLACEYTRLFYGPGKHISPYESVHNSKGENNSSLLCGESSVEIEKLVASLGLTYRPRYTGLPDHVCVQLELMQHMVQREQESLETDDSTAASRYLQLQKDLLQNHLVCWIPTFCDQVISLAELPFYREFARLTKAFIEFEMEELADVSRSLAQMGL
jgi:TorA maturation chaperone TorD